MWDDLKLSYSIVKGVRVALEGVAGSGKSTICKFAAREQLWSHRFSAVIHIHLPSLCAVLQKDQSLPADTPLSLEYLLNKAFPSDEKIPLPFLQSLVGQQSNLLLWIFDDYDEIEPYKTGDGPLATFLHQLCDNELEQYCCCLLASRFEKRCSIQE